MRLDFISLEVLVIGSFHGIRFVMPLDDLMSAGLIPLRCNVTGFVIMMVGSFAYKFSLCQRTVMFT